MTYLAAIYICLLGECTQHDARQTDNSYAACEIRAITAAQGAITMAARAGVPATIGWKCIAQDAPA